MMAVVDASFAGAWVLPDETSADAEKLLSHALEGRVNLVTADLWRYEMCNLLLSAQQRRRIDEPQALEALELLNRIPIVLYDHHEALTQRRVMILASRFSLSAYDAAYLELADRLQCPLYTRDKELIGAMKQIGLPGQQIPKQ